MMNRTEKAFYIQQAEEEEQFKGKCLCFAS
jgi:hypothetical protein